MNGDSIILKGMRVSSRIGVPDEERRLPQTLEVDLELFPAEPLTGLEDRIERTTNYHDVWMRVREIAEAGERRLIETLAEDLTAALLSDPGLEAVKVEVRKFILPDTKSVSVKLARKRSEFS